MNFCQSCLIIDSYFIFFWFAFWNVDFLSVGLQQQQLLGNKGAVGFCLNVHSGIFLKGQRHVAVQNFTFRSDQFRTTQFHVWRSICFLLAATSFARQIVFKRTEPCAVPLANWCAATCVDQIRLLMINWLHAHWHQDFIWVDFLHCILFYYFILCWFSSGAPFQRFPPLQS